MPAAPLAIAPTRFGDVNAVLHDLHARIQAILGADLLGMYLYGSLALGDFDPRGSDIDYIVLTRGEIADALCEALKQMHAAFDAGPSPWAARIEAAYIPWEVARHATPAPGQYPQLEKGLTLSRAPLESGWACQCYTLREKGVAVAGPDPRTLIDPVDPRDLQRSAATIVAGWQDQAKHDPGWLAWVHRREAVSFVVLTLCRILYTLRTGDVASKPAAARWAQATLGQRWAPLIVASLAGLHAEDEAEEGAVQEMLVLLDVVAGWCRS